MSARPTDRTVVAAAAGTGVLLFLAGAGWALAGDTIFLSTMMASLAGCF